MQKDTNKTFREIHGSEEALLAAVEKIERVALVPFTPNISLRLRFLNLDTQSGSNSVVSLTEACDFGEDKQYVAVSYTWAHKQSTEGLNIPRYQIQDLSKPDAPLRAPKCPLIVFHRAMRYTLSKSLTRVWMYVRL
jgi:hypothetical protein